MPINIVIGRVPEAFEHQEPPTVKVVEKADFEPLGRQAKLAQQARASYAAEVGVTEVGAISFQPLKLPPNLLELPVGQLLRDLAEGVPFPAEWTERHLPRRPHYTAYDIRLARAKSSRLYNTKYCKALVSSRYTINRGPAGLPTLDYRPFIGNIIGSCRSDAEWPFYGSKTATIMTTDPLTFQPRLSPAEGAEVMRLLGEIDEFKGHWRKLREIRAERLESLRQVTTIESAGSSTRIEGAQLSDDEVAKLLQGLQIDRFRSRDEADVLGYADLVQTIFDSYEAIPLTENRIKHLHKILLARSENDEWHRGEYKKFENNVEAKHPDGRVEVIFHTASPFDTPRLMADLVSTTNAAFDAGAAHPLVIVARFVVEFLAVHPFQDGNGRLARALTALLLLQARYEYVPYASLERVIEDNKGEYYVALRTSQLAMRKDPADFGAWLVFFLRILHTQKRILEAKLEVERSILRISDTQRRVLELIEKHGRATTGLIAETLGVAPRTVRYHLDMLIRQGLVEPHGERKGRYYTRAAGTPQAFLADPQSRNAAVLAAILARGGRISPNGLRQLLREHGFDPRMAGSLHGRRLAHLRRDSKTGDSILTTRGRELAEQHVFALRWAAHKNSVVST